MYINLPSITRVVERIILLLTPSAFVFLGLRKKTNLFAPPPNKFGKNSRNGQES
jgi:hypothetical protein